MPGTSARFSSCSRRARAPWALACLGGGLILAWLGTVQARPLHPLRRTVAQGGAPEAKRVVVSEGDAKTARLLGELEQELKASSYLVVHVPRVAFEPETLMKTLEEAQASRGILLSDDGKTVMVLSAAPAGGTLRVYAEYSLNHENRLARRRQWIALVERLRVSMEEEQGADKTATQPAPASDSGDDRAPRHWRANDIRAVALAEPLSPTATSEGPSSNDGLGASVALGYITGRTGLTSHLLLSGHHHLTPRLSLLAHVLWPMVQGERTSDGMRSRVWSFVGTFGLMAEPARPSARVNPFVGMTTGLQFLLAYVDRSNQAITDLYRVASLVLDGELGVRILIHANTWLVVQTSVGRAISLSTDSDAVTSSLADSWAFRAAVGLLMSL